MLARCCGCFSAVEKPHPLRKISNSKPFQFKGESFEALCTRVYDGDTATFIVQVPFIKDRHYHWSCRLHGFDAPEMRSKSEQEKRHARTCRDILRYLILNKIVLLRFGSNDKYGRPLVRVYVGKRRHRATAWGFEPKDYKTNKDILNVNEFMTRETCCVAYFGLKKKKDFDYDTESAIYKTFSASADTDTTKES